MFFEEHNKFCSKWHKLPFLSGKKLCLEVEKRLWFVIKEICKFKTNTTFLKKHFPRSAAKSGYQYIYIYTCTCIYNYTTLCWLQGSLNVTEAADPSSRACYLSRFLFHSDIVYEITVFGLNDSNPKVWY